MKVFTDTSFLLSVALQDGTSVGALRWWKRLNLPLHTSDLVLFEAENALRNMRRRGLLDDGAHHAATMDLDRMVRNGSILLGHFQTRQLAAEARRLIAHFASDLPHGSLDVLHVAAARLSRAGAFASFDENQRKLAEAAGMEVVP